MESKGRKKRVKTQKELEQRKNYIGVWFSTSESEEDSEAEKREQDRLELQYIDEARARWWKEKRNEEEPIGLVLRSDVWKKNFKNHPYFKISVKNFEKIMHLDKEKAVIQMLDVLVKTMFVESHLIINGQQTPEELFENMKFPSEKEIGGTRVGDGIKEIKKGAPSTQSDHSVLLRKQEIPFGSPVELKDFMRAMFPVFLETENNKWKHTGFHTLEYCQWLKKQLEESVKSDSDDLGLYSKNFEADLDLFVETKVEEHLRSYAKEAVLQNFKSYKEICTKTSRFLYDEREKSLRLPFAAYSSYALNLPIMTAALYLPTVKPTANSHNKCKIDVSRPFSTTVEITNTSASGRYEGFVLTGMMQGMRVIFYDANCGNFGVAGSGPTVSSQKREKSEDTKVLGHIAATETEKNLFK